MRTASLIGASVVTLLAVSTGNAADAVIEEPIAIEITPVAIWTGGYVGLHAGYGWGGADAVDNGDDFFDEDTGQRHDVDVDGAFGGVQAGYNWQWGSYVLGVEGDLGYLGVDGDKFIVDDPDNFGDVSYGVYGDLTLRAGFAADSWLFYAKGGVAAAQVDLHFGDLLDSGGPDPDSNGSSDSTEVGYTIGGGVEWAFARNWSTKLEYQYFDFGSVELKDDDGDSADVDLDLHTIKIGLNYRF